MIISLESFVSSIWPLINSYSMYLFCLMRSFSDFLISFLIYRAFWSFYFPLNKLSLWCFWEPSLDPSSRSWTWLSSLSSLLEDDEKPRSVAGFPCSEKSYDRLEFLNPGVSEPYFETIFVIIAVSLPLGWDLVFDRNYIRFCSWPLFFFFFWAYRSSLKLAALKSKFPKLLSDL